jgi:hypothetical protein
LIADALLFWRPDLLSDEAPDTGSLTDDFGLIIERAARNDDGLISTELLLRIALEGAHDHELSSALDDLILHRGRRAVMVILQQAVARGELAGDRDWSLVAEAIAATVLLRVVSGQTVDVSFARQIIDTLA